MTTAGGRPEPGGGAEPSGTDPSGPDPSGTGPSGPDRSSGETPSSGPESAARAAAAEAIDRLTRVVPDFPSRGVLFRDLTPVLADPQGLRAITAGLATAAGIDQVEQVAGLEARGFLLAAVLAGHLGTGVLAVRKAGKLPGRVLSESYDLEYGAAAMEVNVEDVRPGARILVVDDVLATGGTSAAACALLRRAGAEVVGIAVAIELAALGGRAQLGDVAVTALQRY